MFKKFVFCVLFFVFNVLDLYSVPLALQIFTKEVDGRVKKVAIVGTFRCGQDADFTSQFDQIVSRQCIVDISDKVDVFLEAPFYDFPSLCRILPPGDDYYADPSLLTGTVPKIL